MAGGPENGWTKLADYWTPLGVVVAALLLGIAKFMGTSEDGYSGLYTVSGILLVVAGGLDLPAGHMRARGAAGIVDLVLEYALVVLALAVTIAAAVAWGSGEECTYDDHCHLKCARKTSLLWAYGFGVATYTVKFAQKFVKGMFKMTSGSSSH